MNIPRGLIKISKKELGLAARDLAKKDLTVLPEATSSFKDVRDPIRLWFDDGEFLYVPRGYYNSVVKKRFQPNIDFKWSSGSCQMRPNTPIVPRDGQEETIAAAIDEMRTNDFGGAIVEANTGAGKTVLAMEIARRLGMKTLFVVHTTVLMEQWIKELRKFMPAWLVGVIQGQACETNGRDVCVAMLQSLALGDDYAEFVYDEFGLIVYDEVHYCGAQEFQKALYKFRPKYILGLSGTLNRKDRAENVFKHGIGPVVKAMNKMQVLAPTIYGINTGHIWDVCSDEPLDRQKNGFLGAIIKDRARNELIVQNTVKAAMSGRHVLVLSERVGHVDELYRAIHAQLTPNGITVGMMVGSTPKEQRKHAEVAQVLVATVQLLAVGFNNPRLDTLVMATPIQGNLEQAIGRVIRVHPDKKPPIVVDLIDTGSEIGKIFALSRRKKYRGKQGWIVKGWECLNESRSIAHSR